MPPSYDHLTATIDWLDLEVTTASSTNGFTIHRKTGIHATPIAPDTASGAANRFRLRLHDISSWWDTERRLERFASAVPMQPEIDIVGLELSLDFRIDGGQVSDLADLAAHLFKFSGDLSSENRRLLGEQRGLTRGVHNGNTLAQDFETLRPIYIGNTSDSRTQRFYVKTVDQAGKTQLAPERWSARVENTYTRREGDVWWLPGDLLDAEHIAFERVAKHFYLRRPSDAVSEGLVMAVLDRMPQVGAKAHRQSISGHPRLYNRMTQADDATNRRIYDALRSLSRSWAKRPKRYQDATAIQAYKDARGDVLCGNLGGKAELTC